MDVFVDHYLILGLPSGCRVSMEVIKTAYKKKALELHPDKRGDDPNAVAEFQELQASYEILKDEKTRKDFDDSLMTRVKQQEQMFSCDHEESGRRNRTTRDHSERSRNKTMRDHSERSNRTTCDHSECRNRTTCKYRTRLYQEESESERRVRLFRESKLKERKRDKYDAKEQKRAEKARIEEEEINKVLEKEFGGIYGIDSNETDFTYYDFIRLIQVKVVDEYISKHGVIDKKKMVRVWWSKFGLDYNVENLRDVFDKFGEVKDVIMSSKNMSSKNERSALIVMVPKEAVVAACRLLSRDRSCPLRVMPLQRA